MAGEKMYLIVIDVHTKLHANGAVVNTAIAIGCAEGFIRNKDSNLLTANGEHIALVKTWAKHLLERIGFVKRRASTKATIDIDDFKAVKEKFLFDVKVVVKMERDFT